MSKLEAFKKQLGGDVTIIKLGLMITLGYSVYLLRDIAQTSNDIAFYLQAIYNDLP